MEQPKLCECGCGQPAPIATKNHTQSGHVKGQPVRFIKGHGSRNGRAAAFKGDAAGYGAIHTYLRTHYPKTGTCEECGAAGKRTEYALIKGREYTRNRDDYRELCKRCHNAYDEIGGSRWRGVITARTGAGEAPLCGCGCGNQVTWDKRKLRWREFRGGHRPDPNPGSHGPWLAVCDSCGNEYQARQRNGRFCSKACKAAYRRRAGLDDVEGTCHQCGSAFTRNRYEGVSHCSRSCAAKCQHAGGCPR